MADSPLKNLEKNSKLMGVFLQAMQDDHLSRADFEKAFKALMEHNKRLVSLLKDFAEENTVENKSNVEAELKKAVAQVIQVQKVITDAQAKFEKEMKSDARTTLRLVEQQIQDIEDSLPDAFDDTDLRAEIEKVRGEIPKLPDAFDPTEIKEDIEELEKEVEELKKRPIGKGGGITDRSLQYAMGRMVKSETPTGAVDGANTTYTVSSTIHAVLGFELGSRVITLGTYSITGSHRKTIEFDTAIPANYSDDSFVIIYI